MQKNAILQLVKLSRKKALQYIESTQKTVNEASYKTRSCKHPTNFTRERKMPFKKLIYFMLTSVKSSTQNALERYFEKTNEDVFITQQSFSEARQKLKVSASIELFVMTVKLAYEEFYETWHGYRVMAIDGSKVALPSDELLRNHYGTIGEGHTSVTAQGSVLYDPLNKVVVDALLEPISTDERTLALRHIDHLCNLGKFMKELILFDRGYPSFELIEKLKRNNLRFLMRVRAKFNLEIDAQTAPDGIVYLKKKGHEDIKLRVVKFPLPSGETEVLISDLWDKRMGINGFKELYFMRWPVETKYDEVKNKLEIENFSGRSVLAIEQEFYITMYMANIAAAAYWEAQEQVASERAKKDNRYHYQVNVNHEIGVLKDRFILALLEDDAEKRSKQVRKILLLLIKRVSPVRPNRSVARKSSSRNSKFHHNQKSNC